ncbi:MAG: NAD(P)H-dependent oxidoreductase subunit E [Desulfovibrio sp.]|nr:NAD(P)H-dependent oxidoreductase subunit E [Desulfovibrio sp.]
MADGHSTDSGTGVKHKFELVVCMGTSCYTMGAAAHIDKLVDTVHQKYGERVNITANICLGQCLLENSRPPYVKLDDDIIPDATIERIVENIDKRCKK